MIRLVWDTSAILNIKEPNSEGYSPGHSLYEDFNQGCIEGPYEFIFPTLSMFEVAASVSRIHRDGGKMLREFWILNEHSRLREIDESLVRSTYEVMAESGFDRLRGADLVFACIAYIEKATLVTLDKSFAMYVGDRIDVLDLNESRDSPIYQEHFNNRKV